MTGAPRRREGSTRPGAIVVGAGVSGLSCALRLLEAGYGVRVWARELAGATTSAVAAALWYPYRVEPADRVVRWGRATLVELVRLAKEPGTGVRLRPGLEVFREAVLDPPWKEAVPGFRRARPDELPPGCVDGYALQVPVADMGIYLGWLARRIEALGGRIERRAISSLDEALAASDLVVNCAGLGARELASDPSVYPVRGQVVRVAAVPGVERFLLDEFAPAGLTYVVPRGDDVVLGGTAQEGEEEAALDAAAAVAIRERCAALEPRLAGAAVSSEAVGLRPCRPTVRLEAERPAPGRLVVHDYGHGGAGVTLSWGCADDVVALARGG